MRNKQDGQIIRTNNIQQSFFTSAIRNENF